MFPQPATWQISRFSRVPAWLVAVCLVFLIALPAQLSIGQSSSDGVTDERRNLSTLHRRVVTFDFEEPDQAPYELPRNVQRIITPIDDPVRPGFPAFGRMRLTDADAFAGKWSFGFELAGGSMAALIPPAVIPILPLGDYAVTVKVKTQSLQHARARITATFYDGRGKPIPASRTASRLINTTGSWDTLSVELRGEFPDAADIVIELQLLQPRQFKIDAPIDQPLLEDVAGRAFFDDLTVWQIPRMEITSAAIGNIFVAPQTPRLNILVRDMTQEPLQARVVISDLRGITVHQEHFPAPRGVVPHTITLTGLPYGWYRAELEVVNDRLRVGRSEIDFTILPPDEPTPLRSVIHFGTVLREPPTERAELNAVLLQRLGVAEAVLPVWTAGSDARNSVLEQEQLRTVLDQLLAGGLDLTLALAEIPPDLSTSLALGRDDVLDLLARDPELWRPSIEHLLVSFGEQVSRWQIGWNFTPRAAETGQLDVRYRAARRALSEFVPDPVLSLPWSAEFELDHASMVGAYHITIPHEVRPEAIADYISRWPLRSADVLVTLDSPPADFYSPSDRVLDLALRTLHAWRAGIHRLAIQSPWSFQGERRERARPDPVFGPWSVLNDRLRNRTFAGELPLGPGIHAWIAQGADSTALILWSPASDVASTRIALALADGPVDVIDVYGNRRRVQPVAGTHRIEVGPSPVFVEPVDGALVHFRAAVRIDPPFAPAVHRVHEHALVLTNPWDVTISGNVELVGPQGWRFSPRTTPFVIRPGETARLPFNLIFDRSVIAGRRRVVANLTISGRADYTLAVDTFLEVGLENIDFSANWSVAQNLKTGEQDLVITQYVTNKSREPVSLMAFLAAPGISQRQRPISNLGPGQTVLRVFRVPNGVAMLAGKQVRVGVAERDGVARLNQLLAIPALEQPTPTTTDATTPQTP